MGRDIRVYVFDDLEGRKVEATRTDVPLAFGSWAGTIDLSDANYERLAGFLAPFLKAGKREGNVNSGQRRGRKPDWYYEGMQAYAAEQGITLKKAPDGKITYPDSLRRDYEAHMAAEWESRAGGQH